MPVLRGENRIRQSDFCRTQPGLVESRNLMQGLRGPIRGRIHPLINNSIARGTFYARRVFPIPRRHKTSIRIPIPAMHHSSGSGTVVMSNLGKQ